MHCSKELQLPAWTLRQSQHSWRAAGIIKAHHFIISSFHHFQGSVFHWAEQVLIRSRQRMKPSLLCSLQNLDAAVICRPASTSALMALPSSLFAWTKPLCAWEIFRNTPGLGHVWCFGAERFYTTLFRGNTRQSRLGCNKPMFWMKMEQDLLLAQSQVGEDGWAGCRIEGGQPCQLCRCSAIKGTSASSPWQKVSEFPLSVQPGRTLKSSREEECCQFHNQFPWLCHSHIWCQQGFVLHPSWCHRSHRWKLGAPLFAGEVGDHAIDHAIMLWLHHFLSPAEAIHNISDKKNVYQELSLDIFSYFSLWPF